MFFGGLVDKDDPEAGALRTKCFSKYEGLDFDVLKMVCGTIDDNIFVTPHKKGDGPFNERYYKSKQYASKNPPHLLPKSVPVHI